MFLTINFDVPIKSYKDKLATDNRIDFSYNIFSSFQVRLAASNCIKITRYVVNAPTIYESGNEKDGFMISCE